MDVTKFVSLLATKTLYFTRADQLGDPWEGAQSPPTVALSEKTLKNVLGPDDAFLEIAGRAKNCKAVRKQTFISCRDRNEQESAAMWKLYLKSDEGIAVRTTSKGLKEAIIYDPPFYIGQIAYIDYTQLILGNNPLLPFLHKRKSFEHECEVRAVVYGPEAKVLDTSVKGLVVQVNLDLLVEEVFVAPHTPAWIVQVVKSVMDKFGLDRCVNQSSLSKDPVY